MSRINNTIKVSGNTTTVLVTKNDDPTYLKEVVIDTANLHLLKKVHVKATGYAWTDSCNLAHLVVGHTSNMDTVVEKGTYGKQGRATKRYSKQFNINKLGEEEALRQAKEWLSNKREEFAYSARS